MNDDKFLDSVTVYRPKSCWDCDFFYNDSDFGGMCCGEENEVESPKEALEKGLYCIFVKGASRI